MQNQWLQKPLQEGKLDKNHPAFKAMLHIISVCFTLPHDSKAHNDEQSLPASVLSFTVKACTKTAIKKVSSSANDSKVHVMQNA